MGLRAGLSKLSFPSRNNAQSKPSAYQTGPPISATSHSTSAPIPPVANGNLWTEAHSCLSEKERKVISGSGATGQAYNPRLIIQYVQDKRKICEDKRWRFQQFGRTIELKETADKVLSWLQKFIAAGDIAVNVDPLHAGLPWAGIRLLAQVHLSPNSPLSVRP